MKTGAIFILSLTAILTLTAGGAFGKYSGGSGTAGDPYQIATKADLLALANNTGDYGNCFILTADINMGGQVFTMAIIAFGPPFTGTFDGNDHKINNFTINGGGGSYIGLFGINSGSVKNLSLENCSVSGAYYVGGLVGLNYSNISNCYSTGMVSGSYCVGELVGYNYGGNIRNCYSTGTVNGSSGSEYVGGLVGWNEGSISDCNSTGTVIGTTTGGDYSSNLGGLVGINDGSISNCYSTGAVNGGSYYQCVGGLSGSNKGNISNCYSTGTVSGSSGSTNVGGLVGWNYSNISNCYSTGAVSGDVDGVGGLVGINTGSISNCYSTGAVSVSPSSVSSVVGGLVGWNYSSISNCYSTGSVKGVYVVGGLVGQNNSGTISSSFWDKQTSGKTTSMGGTGMTTAQMKTLSTFTSAGWDFTNETANGTSDYWRMCVNGVNYPQLNWGYAQYGDFACPDGVGMEDFTYFVQRWLESDCTSSNNDCGGTDMDASGTVDFKDFAIFAENWLSGE
ncbi:MAG: GLUG motif-containing protein [Sedimentisphaerales bacterium]